MKIDPQWSFPENRSAQSVGQSASSAKPNRTEGNPSSSDEVRLSVTQQKIQALQSNLQGLPDIRSERVAALQQAIRAGSYQVSSGQIADAMFSELFQPNLQAR